jgi:hypothetical protein
MESIVLSEEMKAILIANSVADIDEHHHFEKLLQYIDNRKFNSLSELSAIAQFAEERISTISNLSDLEKDGISHDQHPRVKLINWFGNLTLRLARYGAYPTGLNLLVQLWNEYGDFQLALSEETRNPKPFYRAGIGMYLGQLCLQFGERGNSIWWLLHAHADDLLNGQTKGAAHDLLRLSFNVSPDVFEYMKKRKDQNSKGNEPHTLFAEHLVMQLSLEPTYAHLFSYNTSNPNYPIGHAYAQSMLFRVDQQIAEKYTGRPLEEFARYLVLLMPGWIPTENTYHHRTDIDSDIVARYIREPESISSSHPLAILIECKNRKDPLSVSEAGYFLYRMMLTQVEVGILFVRKITGKKGYPAIDEHAAHLLDLAYQQNGKVVVVIGVEDDLEEVAEGKKTLWTLMDSGIVERRFGTSRGKNV